ncbi:hypothetical protein E2C01_025264 [Portunus trituberculatus]|uniref:Uncharacterized protein n=1 Tax=Portunus trituberculatus TaxID=210409 RepID=A0A5B7EG08_PORTR|nr:hypothetical protein [Portunus trituberculatus]
MAPPYGYYVCGGQRRACGPAVTWGAGIICFSIEKSSIFSLHLRPGSAVPYVGAQPCRTVPGAAWRGSAPRHIPAC